MDARTVGVADRDLGRMLEDPGRRGVERGERGYPRIRSTLSVALGTSSGVSVSPPETLVTSA